MADSKHKTLPHDGSSQLSAVEYAATHLRREHEDCPDWLNEMIRESNRMELAKAVMERIIPMLSGGIRPDDIEKMCQDATLIADAMLAEGKK